MGYATGDLCIVRVGAGPELAILHVPGLHHGASASIRE